MADIVDTDLSSDDVHQSIGQIKSPSIAMRSNSSSEESTHQVHTWKQIFTSQWMLVGDELESLFRRCPEVAQQALKLYDAEITTICHLLDGEEMPRPTGATTEDDTYQSFFTHNGLAITGRIQNVDNRLILKINCVNNSDQNIDRLEIVVADSFNRHHIPFGALRPHQEEQQDDCFLRQSQITEPVKLMDRFNQIQITAEFNNETHSLVVDVPLKIFFCPNGHLNHELYCTKWLESSENSYIKKTLHGIEFDSDWLIRKMAENNIFTSVRHRVSESTILLWQSSQLSRYRWMLVEWELHSNKEAKISVKTDCAHTAITALDAIIDIVRS